MTDMPDANESETRVTRTQTASGKASGHVYVYESAGIEEREGNVPIWLWVVVVTLLLWGFYYLVSYWNAPIG